MIGGLVLAAGDGSRFGAAKQLAPLHGRPLIEHAVEAMLGVAAIERFVVVLGARAEEVDAQARLGGTEVLVADDWEEGISASLRAGVHALADCDAIAITLADQPLITSEVIATVIDQAMSSTAAAARATYDGQPAHPVVISNRLFSQVAELRGDNGARDLLDRVGVRAIECGALASAADVDTQADLAAIENLATTQMKVNR